MGRFVAVLSLFGSSLVITAYLFFGRSDRTEPPDLPPPPEIARTTQQALLTLSLPDTYGHLRSLSEWQGRVLIVNYWASWCKPCRKEMPVLSRLHEHLSSRGLQVIGIAADSNQNVIDYMRATQVSYPLLIGGNEAIRLTRAFGNEPEGVPFTLVVDRTGAVRAAVLGAVNETALERLLETLL